MKKWSGWISAIIVAGVLLVAFFNIALSIIPDLFWFSSLGFTQVYLTRLTAKLSLFSIFTGITFVFLLFNYIIVRRILSQTGGQDPVDRLLERLFPYSQYSYSITTERLKNKIRKYFTWIVVFVFAALSVIFGGIQGLAKWDVVLKFLNQASSTTSDPLFGRTISFYFFSLPFFNMIVSFGMLVLFIVIAILLFLYAQHGLLRLSLSVFRNKKVKTHLLILGAMFFALLGVSFWLARYNILFANGNSLFYGAGYTDVNATLLSYTVLALLSFLSGALLLVDIFIPTFKPVLFSAGILIASGIFLGGIYPEVLQNFVVRPNEYEKELPYIAYNIEYTRKAYNLTDIKEKFFPAVTDLSLEDIKNNQKIIDNIRLWDEAPLLKTFEQLQAIRLYYEFSSTDVDRYEINNSIQQVIISARELDTEQLSDKAQNWVNKRLQYTHGYGMVMSPVNKVNDEGMPDFYIKNIPPISFVPYVIDRPEIYFGESTDDYVIVNTDIPEFDYPEGDDNKYTRYKGKRGVDVDSLWRKLLYAAYFVDKNILFSTYIREGSKVLYRRNIRQRVETIAPFLTYDRDPYMIVSDGKLYWIIDGYTSSNKYPYSQPYNQNLNYIRNAAKVVVDAYDGSVNYYIMDEKDPIIQTYSKIYKTMFKPFSSMPAQLQQHIRYPKDYFTVQAVMYRNYHMTNPQVFYNQEDLWEIPKERYEDNEILMEPYYITMKLPEEDDFSFLQFIPFTPSNKHNLISWLVVKNDPHNYGQMLVYKLSKEKQIFGPMQIESRIDQDTTISQQLTLWGQKGSRVIRGNLLIIPVEDSLLYVEPIYLQATASNMPQLKRVVVAYGNRVVMEESLDKAIESIFTGYRREEEAATAPGQPAEPGPEVRSLARQAMELFNNAQQKVRRGDWAGYGQDLQQLEDVLDKLQE